MPFWQSIEEVRVCGFLEFPHVKFVVNDPTARRLDVILVPVGLPEEQGLAVLIDDLVLGQLVHGIVVKIVPIIVVWVLARSPVVA